MCLRALRGTTTQTTPGGRGLMCQCSRMRRSSYRCACSLETPTRYTGPSPSALLESIYSVSSTGAAGIWRFATTPVSLFPLVPDSSRCPAVAFLLTFHLDWTSLHTAPRQVNAFLL